MAAVLPALVACGGESESDSDAPTNKGEVTVTGEFGKAPKVSWTDGYSADQLTAKVLSEGKGAKVDAKTPSVDMNVWIASAEGTPDMAFSTFDSEPLPVPYQAEKDGEKYAKIWQELYSGKYTLGSRILITGSAPNVWGEMGQPSFGIGTRDTSVAVIDLVQKTKEPEPTKEPSDPGTPKVKDVKRSVLPLLTVDPANKDAVTGFKWDTAKVADNKGDVLRAYVKKGTGEKLTAASTVKVQYYGSLYGKDEAFDSSFSRGSEPAEFPLSGVIPGWTAGLTDVPVGSRVVLAIPSRYAYGEAGSGEAIPANSLLYFYVEVVSAS